MHGGDVYRHEIEYDFSVNLNPCLNNKILEEAVESILKKANYYPDPQQERLREAIAIADSVESQCIWCGNGASELIMAVTRAVKPKRALVIAPAFGGYYHAVESLGDCEIVEYVTKEEKEFQIDDSILQYLDESIELMYLNNPINPTGAYVDLKLTEAILEKCRTNNTKVILDETFLPLSDDMDEIYKKKLWKKYDNLFIIRAYTKLFSIPGIRFGYLISNEQNISIVKRQLPEWNVSVVAEAAALEGAKVLKDCEFLKKTGDLIRTQRKYLIDSLKKIGIEVFPSVAGYLLIKTDINLYEELLEEKILIRDCSDYNGLANGFYRIAVKTPGENQLLIEKISRIVEEK